MSDEQPRIPDRAPPGLMLSGELLRNEILADRVFVPGTWHESSLRTSGYNLRLASYPLVRPRRPNSPEYITHDKRNPSNEFFLAPGDSALISTAEAFALDFGISTMIGPQFKWSARGIIMLQGAVAHPGYGLIEQEDKSWRPTNDVRLYFVIANIGPDEVAMRPGDQIAYLQFFSVTPEQNPVEVPSDGYQYLTSKLFSGDAPGDATGLYYFHNIRKLESRLDDVQSELEKQADASAAAMKDLQGKVGEAQTSVDRVSNASDMVVVFGVFLVTVTLLGFVLTNLIGFLDKPRDFSLWQNCVILGLEILFAAATVYAARLVTVVTRNVPKGRSATPDSGDAR
jgi:deoxycytidine triphosphate deaminase